MPVRITDLTLRDGHQSLLATRMRTEDMLPIAEKMDAIGFASMEVWGGATFDTALRFLNEDPWERLRLLKKHIKKTPLMMLLRGQNVVGYRHYADDVLERFVVKARENGLDIFRIFDALNDVHNLEKAMAVAKREGGHVQAAFCYTISPIHSLDSFVRMARQFVAMGADSICIKDMSGIIAPYDAYELVRRLKEEITLPLQLHSHYTSGMACMAVLKAVEAGVDIVDTDISSMALGTAHAPTESIVAALKGTPYDPGLDLQALAEIATYFGEVRRRYAAFESELFGVDTNVITHQVPGGMISNLIAQLREQNALDRFEEVLQEVPRVREDLGYPPLVTPSSQFVGTQAVLNVLTGGRYKAILKEVRAYLQGYYGQPPGAITPELLAKIPQEERITCRPADLLKPELAKAQEELGSLARSEEDVLSYALFPQVAKGFLELRQRGEVVAPEVAAAITALLAKDSKKPVTAPAPTDGSAWKRAGREALMRSRL